MTPTTMQRNARSRLPAAALLIPLCLVACTRQLMPTPTVHAVAADDPFSDVPPPHRTGTVDLVYITDRAPVARDGRLAYGWKRSPSVSFGSCVVALGQHVSWDDLVRNSRSSVRDMPFPLGVESITELGSFPPTPHIRPEDPLEQDVAAAALRAEIDRRLAQVPRKEVFLFVHGFHNSFDIASYIAAEIWHFLPREGVPILYSWPAGHGGLLQGYEYDRESGLYTVGHLQMVLELLASWPEIEGINIVAHSRGTAVVVDALGELVAAVRASGRDPRIALRINELVLAAADIDVEVAAQRIFGEGIDRAVGRTTAYVSQHDDALSLSSWLFADRRLGRLSYSDLTDHERAVLAAAQRFSVVDVRAHTSGLGHDYFHSAPAASSDLILVLRDGLDPGTPRDTRPGGNPGRPLVPVGPNYWELDDDYEAATTQSQAGHGSSQ